MTRAAAVAFVCALSGAALAAQGGGLKAAIDNLGKFDAPVRTAASREVRRAPAAQAVPALMAAASGHADGYVRFRALVLLAGFNDPRAREVMLSALDDPNDRLRTVAYAYFEHRWLPLKISRGWPASAARRECLFSTARSRTSRR